MKNDLTYRKDFHPMNHLSYFHRQHNLFLNFLNLLFFLLSLQTFLQEPDGCLDSWELTRVLSFQLVYSVMFCCFLKLTSFGIIEVSRDFSLFQCRILHSQFYLLHLRNCNFLNFDMVVSKIDWFCRILLISFYRISF